MGDLVQAQRVSCFSTHHRASAPTREDVCASDSTTRPTPPRSAGKAAECSRGRRVPHVCPQRTWDLTNPKGSSVHPPSTGWRDMGARSPV